ncbi:MAG: DUF1285 domain-containing protein [Rhodospirillales bacterium]
MTKSATDSPTNRLGREAARSQPAEGEKQAPRDLQMRIDVEGTWYYRGSPIRRPGLVKLFASVLRREADGSYWLVTPVERGLIAVEDAPFVAVDCEVSGSGRAQDLRFRTNLDHEFVADADHPLRVAETAGSAAPRPYVMVKPGLEALIARAVFYRLADLAVGDPDHPGLLGVWSGGCFFPLGPGE